MDDVFSQVNNLEDHFYRQGFQNGQSHGEIHGRIEGRVLGRKKGFEIWEELGYIEGWAKAWRCVLVGSRDQKSLKSLHGLEQLINLISHYPMTNDSSSVDPEPSQREDGDGDTMIDGDGEGDSKHGRHPDDSTDISAALTSIRSKYKVVCASMGLRPRLRLGAAPTMTV